MGNYKVNSTVKDHEQKKFTKNSDGDTAVNTVSDPSRALIDTNEVVMFLLGKILDELKIMNSHLGDITDEEKTKDDID